MPTLILIAGPNGAGKTSFASKHLPAIQADSAATFVNADEIAREPAVLSASEHDMRAGRLTTLADRGADRRERPSITWRVLSPPLREEGRASEPQVCAADLAGELGGEASSGNPPAWSASA